MLPLPRVLAALKHGLSAEYIQEMRYDSSCEGFEVRRLPPRETNVIAIRLLSRPEGILEMIAEAENGAITSDMLDPSTFRKINWTDQTEQKFRDFLNKAKEHA